MKPPKNPKSRKYRRIVNRGCGGSRDYWGEYSCDHVYDWICEECPCCLDARMEIRQQEAAKNNNTSQVSIQSFLP